MYPVSSFQVEIRDPTSRFMAICLFCTVSKHINSEQMRLLLPTLGLFNCLKYDGRIILIHVVKRNPAFYPGTLKLA